MKNEQKISKRMNLVVWIAQCILATGFIWAASMKLLQSPEKLAEMWSWTASNPELVKLTGILDLLAGIGLTLPALLNIQPRLTIYTAYGTILLMIAASIFHILRGEASQIGVNIFFAGMAGFIAWARNKQYR